MDSRGQHFCTSGSEVSSGASLSASSLAMEDVALAPSIDQQGFPHLRPLIVKMPGVSGGFRGELVARSDVLGQTYSPKGLVQNMMQPTRPQQPSARLGDLSAYPQYEDFAGILGDRLASGSLSDVSVSAMSERAQICSSGHSSYGENSGPRLKLMCSFGGKILPRPVDGKLRYVGGDTRIVSIHRHTSYTNLLYKMRHVYGKEVILKYQLPNEDLDALITILSDEDVDNMMEEYDRLEACESSSRLRIFLFSPAEYNANPLSGFNDSRNTDQLYVDTINGIPEPCSIKHTDIVTMSCSNTLTGVEIPDTWSGPVFVKNVSVALPVAPVLQVTGACIKPMPVAMPSYTKQVMLRNVSASPSVPSSPTISSQLAQAKQCTIPDLPLHVYSDQSAKTPMTHFHEMQRLDAIYQEAEGARSPSSSLGSQNDGIYQPSELRRAMDPSLVTQIESGIEQACRLEQDPMMSRTDSHLPRMLRVSSHTNLVPVMQQNIEVETPFLDRQLENNLPDVSHPPSHLQNFTLQQEVPSSQVGWQHALESRRIGYQAMDMVQLTALENIQAHQQVLNQQMGPQYYLPGGTSTQELAYLRPVEQPVQLAYPPTILQSSTTPGMVPIPSSVVHPGSAPASPRVVSQENKLNQSMAPQYATGQRRFIGPHVDQPYGRKATHSNFYQANRVSKPSNMHIERQEQVLRVVDGPIRQHLPAPLSKIEGMQTANNLPMNREVEPLQSCFVDDLTRPMLPPYPGAGLYQEQATIFEDHGVIRTDDQRHAYEEEDGFNIQSQYQGAVDWAWKRGQNENNINGWTQTNHLDPHGELNLVSNGNTGKPLIQMDGVGMQMLETSFATTAANDTHLTTNENSGIYLNVGLQAQIPSQMENKITGLLVPPSLYKDTAILNPLVKPILQKPDEKVHAESVLPLFSTHTVLNKSKPDSSLMGHLGEVSFRIPGDATSNDGSINHAFGLSDSASPHAADTAIETITNYSLINYDNHLSNIQTIPSSCPSSPGGSMGNSNMGLNAGPAAANINLSTGLSASAVGGSQIVPPMPFVFESGSVDVADYTMQRKSFSNTLHEDVENAPLKADMIFSENARLTDTTNAMLASSFQVLNSIDRKGDYPRFDSDTLDGTGNLTQKYENLGSSVELAVKDVNVPTIYSAPTLSLQNWEESLAKVGLEEEAVDPAKDGVDEGTLAVVQKDIQELKIGLDDGIADENVANKLSLAAQAEEEAISRGLQTIKNADLEELRELGTGTFGTVYHGKWRGTDVAIKRIKSSCFTGRPSERERLLCDFWREAFILGQLHHPNVVAFYGVVPDGPGETLATVTEYMVNGSLKQVLQKKDRTIDRRKRLLIIMDAAFGMEYLHGKNIVHFDLKCENLLVNMKDPHRPICKVGDLGLSKVKHQTMVSGGVRGTLPWMAPELLNGSDSLVSEKVDVFSFGIVMWELLTGEEPYANMHYGAIIGGIVNNTLRPTIPSWCDPSWKSLMERCWSADPAQRPAFLEVAAELRSMANAKSQGQGQAHPQASASV